MGGERRRHLRHNLDDEKKRSVVSLNQSRNLLCRRFDSPACKNPPAAGTPVISKVRQEHLDGPPKSHTSCTLLQLGDK